MSNDTEDTVEVIGTVPMASQAKRTEISSNLKERVVVTKDKTLTTRENLRLPVEE